MSADLVEQIRDYLDWVEPVTAEEVVVGSVTPVRAQARRNGLLVAVGVAVLVLAVGLVPAMLLGDSPGGSSDWCPPGELRDSWDEELTEPVVCDGPIVGSWELVSIEVAGEPIDIPSFAGRDWAWVGLTFGSDGGWNGRFCNVISGFYKMSADTIVTSVGGTTLAGCWDDEEAVERTVFDMLYQATISVTISGDHLELKDGETTMELVRATAE